MCIRDSSLHSHVFINPLSFFFLNYKSPTPNAGHAVTTHTHLLMTIVCTMLFERYRWYCFFLNRPRSHDFILLYTVTLVKNICFWARVVGRPAQARVDKRLPASLCSPLLEHFSWDDGHQCHACEQISSLHTAFVVCLLYTSRDMVNAVDSSPK